MQREGMKLTVFFPKPCLLDLSAGGVLATLCEPRRSAASPEALMDSPILAPPHTKPHLSVAKLTRFFYVACLAEELGASPLPRVIAGVPLVLFRSGGRAAALIDRCPHRNVPLSLGRVLADGRLECAYHGWQ